MKRLPLLLFIVWCSVLLRAQTDTTLQMLQAVNDERITRLEDSFFTLLVFNWAANAFLLLFVGYIVVTEYSWFRGIRFWFKNSKFRPSSTKNPD